MTRDHVPPPFPAHPAVQSERDLSFARPKPRWFALSVAYRVMRAARGLFGDRRVLRWLLNTHWLLWRFSFETTVEHYGGAFPNATFCLSDELLGTIIPPGGSVLDIGCGGGRVSQLAAKYAGRVVGIDYDAHNIGVAKAANRYPHVEYRLGDVTAVLPGERFDVAVLVAILEHIEDADGLLRQIHRVAPRLVVEVPDFDQDVFNLVRRDLGCVWYTDADHVREYTRDVLKQHLERNGWTPTRWEFRGGMQLAVCESALTANA
jgi:SAM-dependent methyltransferase